MCAGQSSQWQYWEQLDLHFQSVTSEMDLNWSRWRKRGWDFVTDEKMFQSNRNLSEFNHKVERLRLLQSLPKKRFPVALHAPVAIKYHKNKSVGTDPGGGGSNSSPRSNKILKQDRQRKQICLKKKKKHDWGKTLESDSRCYRRVWRCPKGDFRIHWGGNGVQSWALVLALCRLAGYRSGIWERRGRKRRRKVGEGLRTQFFRKHRGALSSIGPSVLSSLAWWFDRTAAPPGTGRTHSVRSWTGCSSWRVMSSPARPGLRSLLLVPPIAQREGASVSVCLDRVKYLYTNRMISAQMFWGTHSNYITQPNNSSSDATCVLASGWKL